MCNNTSNYFTIVEFVSLHETEISNEVVGTAVVVCFHRPTTERVRRGKIDV